GLARNDAQRLLPFQTLRPDRVPADAVAAAIFVDIRARHMMGPMACAERQIEEKWPLRRRGPMVADIGDGVIHQVGAEVIFASRLQSNRAIVAVQLRIPLIGQGTVKSVP